MLKAELYDYQKTTVEFGLNNRYAILALEMGLGKSVIALAIAERVYSSCLIICPAYLVLNWKKEISKCISGRSVSVFTKSADVYYPFDSDYVIISYDLAIKFDFLFEWAKVVVLDEANAVKSMKAKRTQAIHRLIFENSTQYLFLLTGTPIKNRVQEFYSLIALCNYKPGIQSQFLTRFESEVDFADHFAYRQEFTKRVRNRYFKIVKWDGLRNEPELKAWLKDLYISKRNDFGKVNYKDVVIDDYDDENLRQEFDDFQKGVSRVAPQVKAKAALRKSPLTCEYVENLVRSGEAEGPIVIFTDHRESCHFIANHFKTTAITGEMSVVARQNMADSFQRGEIPVLVATIGSFSTGYTLTASNFVVFNDYPWTPGDLAQAEYRVNRIGQTRPVHVHRMLGSEQDEYILKTILSKQDVISKVY